MFRPHYVAAIILMLLMIDAGTHSSLAIDKVHGYHVGTYRSGDIGNVIYRYIERSILYLDTGVRAHAVDTKHKCDDQTYPPFKQALQANLKRAESDGRHLVWINELRGQACGLILGHGWSHGIFSVKYETLLYSPVSCSQINEFIASDSFARSYDRPILVSGNMTGEAKLESDTELLRDIHNQYVTCEDLGPQKLMIKASFPRKIGSR